MLCTDVPRIREQGEELFTEVSQDLEARCRSYVEYAATDCQVKEWLRRVCRNRLSGKGMAA